MNLDADQGKQDGTADDDEQAFHGVTGLECGIDELVGFLSLQHDDKKHLYAARIRVQQQVVRAVSLFLGEKFAK